MKYSVIIPTNRAIEKILPLLQSLEAQTEQASAIFIVYDKILGPSELSSMQTYVSANCSDDFADTIEWITNINHAFVPHTGVSYMRNFAINAIKTPYILYVDDDNTFAHDFTQRLLHTATAYHKQYNTDCILIPTERYQWSVRSRGYRRRNRLLGTTIGASGQTEMLGKENVLPISFAASNCLRWSTEIFRSTPFDADMPFVYEDFDMTIRAKRKWVALFCLTDLAIEHHMCPKSKLQDMYIDTADRAYQKSKNRLIFAKHYYANSAMLLVYLCTGLWIHTAYLILLTLYAAPRGQKYSIIDAILQGTKAGLYSFRSSSRAWHDWSI
jgi:GT2 family glycosyltransferase